MSSGEKEAPQPGMDISACLEAVHMYNAAYHLLREHYDPGYEPPAPPEKSTIVSLWEYLWAIVKRTCIELVILGLYAVTPAAGLMIIVNAIHNIHDYSLAQPTVHTEYFKGKPYTWTEPSLYPLPPHWEQTNLILYTGLIAVIYLGFLGINRLLRKANAIKPGVPIQYADTAHLSPQESLVRASQEPETDNLMRAAEEPIQKTLGRVAAPPSDLLRAAGRGQETPPKQLVRAAEKSQ